jgi:nitroreductase
MVERSMWKYQTPRYYRAMCMELGHFSQTFYLVSTWLGLGAFFVGALREEPVEKEVGLDWTREIVLGANGAGAADLGARAAGPVRPHR